MCIYRLTKQYSLLRWLFLYFPYEIFISMKYKLVLLKLLCFLPDESDGDEIFILMDGKRIWPIDAKFKTVKAGEILLDIHIEIQKGDIIDFELWDHDTLSPNDLLGKITLKADAHGHFTNDFVKTGSDKSKYALEWEIG